MKVLIGCEFSGVVRRAFRARGHDAWSCDLLPADDDSPFHIQGNVLPLLSQGWDLGIMHPPCTYLCRSGWHWVNRPDCAIPPLKGEPRRRAAKEAAEFFKKLLNAPIEKVAVENPRPICHVNLPPPTQIIHPWQFGHGELKTTGLWLRGLRPLVPTNIVEGREARIHKMPPGEKRGKERSRFYPGIADAMAEQWGDPMNDPMF